MTTQNEVLKKVSNHTFLARIFSRNIDWNENLDTRDSTEFDSPWRTSHDTLNTGEYSESETTTSIRESVFKQVFHLTQNADLAGYVSDDFGLIAMAFDCKADIEFVNNLWESYCEGSFPGGQADSVDRNN
ncbi:hypothetical protein [Pseudomonas purpurea]|uniref:hypothetical protein n=1 Tax=Pseudomonas purpurea TaxID=3136737 RepID=UPI0032655D39